MFLLRDFEKLKKFRSINLFEFAFFLNIFLFMIACGNGGATHDGLAKTINNSSPTSPTNPTKPTISSFAVLTGSPTNSTTWSLNFTSSSFTSGYSYCILENSTDPNNCAWSASSLPTSFNVSATNGSKILSAWIKDAAGNISDRSDSGAVTLNTALPSAPTLSLTTPSSSPGNIATPTITASGVTVGDTITFYSGSCSGTQLGTATVSSGTSVNFTLTSNLSSGVYNFYAQSTNQASTNSSCSSALTYTLDTTNPTVSNVTASGNGPFAAGATFKISILFSESVVVAGTPVLNLNTGRGGAQASYASGSNSNTLIFNYTVVSGDNASDLSYTDTSSLTLNSGTIKDVAGNDATLTLPAVDAANSLSANQQIVLDTAAPTSVSISINGGAAYTTSTTVPLTLAATGASEMYITNTSGCGSGGAYEAYSTSKSSWTLTTANSVNTVYAKFRDLAGNESSCVSDNILHDDTGPTAPTGLSLGAVPNSDTTTPSLSWNASTDNAGGSGVASYQAEVYKTSDNSIIAGCSWTSLNSGSSLSCTAGALVAGTQYYMKVRAIDNAGNIGTASSASANWTAQASLPIDPCVGSPTPGTVCSGGAIYLGSLSPGAISGAGTDRYMTTPGGCGDIPAGQKVTTPNTPLSDYPNADFTPTCSGADSLGKFWNNGTNTNYDIPGLTNYMTTTGTGQGAINTDQNYGSSNTTTIVAITADANGGYHAAARYCDKLSYGGYTDWYLPNRYELNLMYTNKTSIPGLNTGGAYYWSSTEAMGIGVWTQRFSDGNQTVAPKYVPGSVRCVRKF